jgi:hypothetical protein
MIQLPIAGLLGPVPALAGLHYWVWQAAQRAEPSLVMRRSSGALPWKL